MTATWHPVPAIDIADFLGMFGPRGQGMVRDGAVHTVTVTPGPDSDSGEPREVLVDVTDARHGRWRLTLSGATVRDALSFYDDDPAWATAAAALQHGTWEVHDSAGCHYGVGRPVFARGGGDWKASREQAAAHLAADPSGVFYVHGRARATVTFTDARVEREMLDRVPGSCVACGSTRFRMQALATVPVRLTHGPDGAVSYIADTATTAELAESTRLRNAFGKLACVDCSTPQETGRFGNLAIDVGSPGQVKTFSQRTSIRLADLLSTEPGDV